MKYFLLLALVLSGISCDSSSESPNTNTSELTVSSAEGFIVGGGRWFEGSDTATYFDAYPSFTLKNTSDGWQEVTYTYTFGLLKGNEIITDDSKLITRTGPFSKTVSIAPLSTTVIHDTLLIDLGRKQHDDWTLPYGYGLAVNAGGESTITIARLTGSSPYNRFHGVVVTAALSSDSLGMLDEPDDGDYRAAADSHMVIYPIFPNPSTLNGYLTFRFRLNRNSLVQLSVHRTPRSVIYQETEERIFMDGGMYEYDPPIRSRVEQGQYRIYINSLTPGRPEFVSYGDFFVLK